MDLTMTPSEVYRKFVSHGKDKKYIQVLAELNGCQASDIQFIINKAEYFNGELPVNFDYVYKDVDTGSVLESEPVKEVTHKRKRPSNLLTDSEKEEFKKYILDGLSVEACAQKLNKEVTSGIKSIYYTMKRSLKEEGYNISSGKRGRKRKTDVQAQEISTNRGVLVKPDVSAPVTTGAKATVKKDLARYFSKHSTETGSIADISESKKTYAEAVLEDIESRVTKESNVSGVREQDNKIATEEQESKAIEQDSSIIPQETEDVSEEIANEKSSDEKEFESDVEEHQEAHHVLKDLLSGLSKCGGSNKIQQGSQLLQKEEVLISKYSESVTLDELEISILAYKEMVNFVNYQRDLWLNSMESEHIKRYNLGCLDTKLALLDVLGSLLNKLLEVKKNG